MKSWLYRTFAFILFLIGAFIWLGDVHTYIASQVINSQDYPFGILGSKSAVVALQWFATVLVLLFAFLVFSMLAIAPLLFGAKKGSGSDAVSKRR